jgi:hypothetical protein
MTERYEEQRPLARRERLLIEELPDEILIYDLDRKKAHCLNQSAALIWNHCDGNTKVKEITQILVSQLKAPVEEEAVWFGLDQLYRNHLLEEEADWPNRKNRLSRRELIQRIGLAVSVPFVMSIVAPKASAALSCVTALCPGGVGCPAPCACNTLTNVCNG